MKLVYVCALLAFAASVCAQCTTFPYTAEQNPCAEFVTYPIAADTDIDAVMKTITSSSLAPMPHCLYFNLWSFMCQKHFPACTPGTGTVRRLCTDVCLKGRDSAVGKYRCAAVLSEDEVIAECSTPYFDSTSSCRNVEIMDTADDGSDDTWKYILIGVLLGVAAVIGAFMLYRYCSAARVSPELTDADIARPFEHEVEAAKRKEKLTKARAEENAKAQKKMAKKKGVTDEDVSPVDTEVEMPPISSRFEQGVIAAGNAATPHHHLVTSTPSKNENAHGSRPASPYSLFNAQKQDGPADMV